jgi:hypothetical protein
MPACAAGSTPGTKPVIKTLDYSRPERIGVFLYLFIEIAILSAVLKLKVVIAFILTLFYLICTL